MSAIPLVCASFTLLAYAYLGYPVAIVVLARLFPCRVVKRPGFEPRVSVLIPAFNAERLVGPKLDSLLTQDYPHDKLEILVYSDGSTDKTDAVVAAYAARHPELVRLLRGDVRRGKPTALNHMRAIATGEVFVLTDVRQPLSCNAIRALVDRLSDPEVGCASGNLVLAGATGAGLYWRYERAIRMAEARFRSTVGASGTLYAIRREDFHEIPIDTILDDLWIPLRVRFTGRRIVFCADAIAYDHALEDGRELHRKIRTLAGNYQIFARLPRALVPFVNPIWFETFSHKLLRLVCPWALVTLAIATIAAAVETGATSFHTLLGFEAAFAVAALVGQTGGKLAGTARTFVVLNWAAVVGLYRFVRRSQQVTW